MKAQRDRGAGRIFPRGRFVWIQYSQHGVQVRESTKIPLDSKDWEKKAEKKLRGKLGEIAAGVAAPVGASRVMYNQVRDALLADYQTHRRKWLRIGKEGKPYICGLSHLDDFFAGWRAAEISTDTVRKFVKNRQEAHSADGTINRSLALLRRMLRLAVQDGILDDVPHIPMLRESAPRKGFLEHGSYQKVRQELPEYLRPVLALAYWTGMRKGEILTLRWSNVDLAAAEIRLDETKNGERRTVPLTGELLEMLKIERERHPDGEWVFTRDGEPIGSFVKAWASAAKRAGVPGLLFHDLRRTGIRNMLRSGVLETVAMSISGHRTRSVFDRYNVTSGKDLKDAANKLETYLASQKDGDNTGTIAKQKQEQAAIESK